MAKNTGIQLNDNNDTGEILDIKIHPERDASGKIIRGIVVGDTLQQNKALILMAYPGDMKSRPDIGVGIQDILLNEDYLLYRHRIREHFNKDGLTVRQLDLYANKPIIIDADYNS